MTVIYNEASVTFPFDKVRDTSGDYFNSVEELRALGYELNQIWSVVESSSQDDAYEYTITTGPAHHKVNLIGYFATAETHDHDTYYFEHINPLESSTSDNKPSECRMLIINNPQELATFLQVDEVHYIRANQTLHAYINEGGVWHYWENYKGMDENNEVEYSDIELFVLERGLHFPMEAYPSRAKPPAHI